MSQPPKSPPRPAPQPKKEPPKPVAVEPPQLDRYVEVGDVVQWYPAADPTGSPQPAVVTKIGSEGIVVANVMNHEIHDTIPQDGCYPMDHPRARQMGPQEGGGWRHKPMTIAVRSMLIGLGLLEWNDKDAYEPTRRCAAVVAGDESLDGRKREEPQKPEIAPTTS